VQLSEESFLAMIILGLLKICLNLLMEATFETENIAFNFVCGRLLFGLCAGGARVAGADGNRFNGANWQLAG
jgi:hypothetical protein